MKELPKPPSEIKPHPHGVELGILIRMLKGTDSRSVSTFLQNDFCRVGSTSAEEICRLAGVELTAKPAELDHSQQEKLIKAIQKVSLMRPPTNCLSPIGESALEEGLKKETGAEFVTTVTRSPEVYRGNPFQIEVGIAWGGDLAGSSDEEETDPDKRYGQVKLMRFANKMPLLYEAGSCATSKAISSIKWRTYGLDQPGGGIPHGPAAIVIHMCSTWVPYTSESKEAIAAYDEIIGEIKLAVQECGRRLARYVSGIKRRRDKAKRAGLFETYLPEISQVLSDLSGEKKEIIDEALHKILDKHKVEIINNGEANDEGNEKEN